MPKYAMLFHAKIEAPSQRAALVCASQIEDAVACDFVLMDTGDYVKSFDLDDWELLEDEGEEDES